jgi:hypothetical protein
MPAVMVGKDTLVFSAGPKQGTSMSALVQTETVAISDLNYVTQQGLSPGS